MNFNFSKFLKAFLKYCLFVFIGLIAYAAIAISIAYIPVNANVKPCTEHCVEVYLRSNGVHTDIVLPMKNEMQDWSIPLDSKKTKAGNTNFNYVSIGWGDKGFYLDAPTWGDLTFKTAFNALFYLSSSAMHVTYFNQLTEGERCKRIFISKGDYMKIVSYVNASFQVNESKEYIQIPDVAYGNNDAFYEAKGRYSLFYTCNTWTNNCLKAGGMKACLWTLFDKGIFYQYK